MEKRIDLPRRRREINRIARAIARWLAAGLLARLPGAGRLARVALAGLLVAGCGTCPSRVVTLTATPSAIAYAQATTIAVHFPYPVFSGGGALADVSLSLVAAGTVVASWSPAGPTPGFVGVTIADAQTLSVALLPSQTAAPAGALELEVAVGGGACKGPNGHVALVAM